MSVVDLILPKLGESIMEATILKWHKAVGDTIQLDETLLDIATDKVDSEIPSTTAGTITEILFEVNAVVPIGTVIARIQTSGSNDSTPKTEKVQVTEIKKETAPAVTIADEVPFTPSVSNVEMQQENSNEARFFSPLVLNIAQNEGVSFNELQLIPGTGSQGRVSKKDILHYIAQKKAGFIQAPINTVQTVVAENNNNVITQTQAQASVPPTTSNANSSNTFPPADYGFNASNGAGKFASPDEVIITGNTEIIEMDRMRKLIAKHMVESVQTSPHVTSFV
ncbi:MAG: biotin/lipoyl-containing protein, partial [Sediminibacterium sp.]